ncbi:DgyrCDS12443 [Dimorphilus gyrociliatus]|uniref:DgyrCDS12443 n=1 Tax=Dimorphilus gyrociliatus TaxID=2664684 RepID=A0A7I8W6G0_9ANNE|nr:DgyrCDS12443 [Dimorphilus gyrociliatus]
MGSSDKPSRKRKHRKSSSSSTTTCLRKWIRDNNLTQCTGPRPLDRMPLKIWLTKVLNEKIVPGVVWIDKSKLKFRIPWKHMSRSSFDKDRDMELFRMYAQHSGKQDKDCKQWKTNFRCALNSLRSIERVKDEDQTNQDEAYRVFRFKEQINFEVETDCIEHTESATDGASYPVSPIIDECVNSSDNESDDFSNVILPEGFSLNSPMDSIDILFSCQHQDDQNEQSLYTIPDFDSILGC